MKKTICIDFDGVIHSYKSGWKGIDIIPDEPVKGAFEMLREYIKIFDVCIYSSRSKSEKGRTAMKMWFLDHGFENDDYQALRFPARKPPAWITIDDRCICFNGKFPDMDEIENFKPWYKK